MAEILGLTKARDVWIALEQAFCPSSQSQAHQLRDELQFLKRGMSPTTVGSLIASVTNWLPLESMCLKEIKFVGFFA